MKTKYIKVFSDFSEITVNALKVLLENNNIKTMIKNPHDLGKIAGFGTFDKVVELFVLEEDFEKANTITNTFKDDLKD